MPRGGRRDGAGRPKGSKDPHTLARELVREALAERARKKADAILNSQFAIAEGCSFLYRVEQAPGKGEKRRHVLVTSPEEIQAYLNGDRDASDYHYITTERPNNDAIKDIWDRFVTGKPVTSVELGGPGGRAIPVEVRFVDA